MNIFSKILKKLVYNLIVPLLKKYIRKTACIFPKRSVETNLIEYFQFIMDKVNNNLFITKLPEVGIHGNLLLWFAYIFNKSQMVNVEFSIGPLYNYFRSSTGFTIGAIAFLNIHK